MYFHIFLTKTVVFLHISFEKQAVRKDFTVKFS
jgi:hypothetical protein